MIRPVPVLPSPKSQAYEPIEPSGSYEADASNVIVSRAVGAVGLYEKSATGGARTRTDPDAVAVSPSLSVTWSMTVYVPPVAKAWLAVGAVPSDEVPSPKVQRYRTIVPSGSVEAEASNVTVSPAFGLVGEYVNAARGRARTVTDAVAEAVRPWESVTVNLAVKTPDDP